MAPKSAVEKIKDLLVSTSDSGYRWQDLSSKIFSKSVEALNIERGPCLWI